MLKHLVCLSLITLPVQAASGQSAALTAEAQAFVALQQMDQRVATIGHRIAKANLDICPRQMPLPGLLVHAIEQYAARTRPTAAAVFGLADDPALLSVIPGSAADRAGLIAGDRIVSINGRSFPGPSGRKGSYARVQQVEEHLLAELEKGPVRIDYVRQGAASAATLEPEQGCLSRVQLIPSTKLNAKADGTYAQLTSAIVDFTKSEEELALVIGHEMAHNILGHKAKLDEQKVRRGVLKSFDGSAGKIKVTEKEADYLALYLAARAGYDISGAPGFWDRYGRKMGFGIFSDGTHPGRSSRMEASERTISEIKAKQERGEPILPQLPYQG